MRKILLLTAMYIGMIFSANGQTSVWDGSHSTWTNGAGTQESPYLIENAAQLAHLAYIVNNGIGANNHTVGANIYWKLMTDIDLNGSETFQWTPIGYANSSTDYYSFGGTFDGNDHTVVNLYINTTALSLIGLFGWIDGATIKNLGITGSSSVTGGSALLGAYAGGIAGYASNTTINNCYNTGSVSSFDAGFDAGGIVGYAVNTAITDCNNTGSVAVSNDTSWMDCYSGGIVGLLSNSTITDCKNTGSVSSYSFSSYSSSGGICGDASGFAGNIIVNRCYNTGSVSSDATDYSTSSGGIVGDAESTTVNNCYNIGTIYSDIDVYQGGIAGYSSGGAVNYSYYLVTCGGGNTYGGEVKTEEAMKDAGFVTLLNQGLATPAWKMDCTTPINNGFPVLLWQTCEGPDAVETIESQSINIYPNPAKDVITVASSELQNANYTVFSISGQALMYGKLQGETTTVNVSTLPSGIYFIKAGNYAGRFVKQ